MPQDKTGAIITPGWKEVLDRSTGKLVPCDATTCPKMVDGVNYAPFASFGGWSGRDQRGRAEGATGRRLRLPVVHERARAIGRST